MSAPEIEAWLHGMGFRDSHSADPKVAWMRATADALQHGTELPPVPREGKTTRPWRAAVARVETITRLLDQSGQLACNTQPERITP